MSKNNLSKKERHALYLKRQEEYKKDLNRTYEMAIVVAMHASCLYLRDKQGYGRKRLGDFIEGFANIIHDIGDGYLDFEDIIDTLYEETGVKIKMEDIYGQR